MRIGLVIGLLVSSLLILATGESPAAHIAASGKPAGTAAKASGLQAAFVRGGELWVKDGDAERQLTRGTAGTPLRYPKWSQDGQWIAYMSEQENARLLQLIPSAGGQPQSLGPTAGTFAWSPSGSSLAYIAAEGTLRFVDAKSPGKPTEVAQGISSFAWLPDGSGFLASTQAQLKGGDDWTQVKLLRIPLSAAGDPARFVTLYELPKASETFFAVGTSTFKWSASGRWIAFLATPTASLSADGNTLCILSSDGKVFRQVDEMVNNEEWFDWAGQADSLAYIGGGGRMATSNKQLRAVAAPAGQPVIYTPQGKVDQGFAWNGDKRIIVSRAKESEWQNEPGKRPYPALFEVDLGSRKQRPLTKAARLKGAKYGEYDPVILSKQRLGWVRSNRSTADVMLADKNGRHAAIWIRGIDLGDNYYEQWRWDAVLDYRTTGRK